MISIVLLKNRLADWERLYEVRLAESDMRLWLDTFKHIRCEDDVLLEAFTIVQSKAVRFPKPAQLVAAIEAAMEVVGRRQPKPVDTTPHISELSQAERDEMDRMTRETKQKLGITELYPETKRRTVEQVEEDARIERNRQKEAIRAILPAPPTGKPLPPSNLPSRAAAPAPAPGPAPVESTEITDEDIPF